MPAQTHYEMVLQAAQEDYAILPLQGDARALITKRGARVLGIFPTSGSENLLWTHHTAWQDAAHLADFVAAGGWNIGGERLWIAPEIQYNVRDRADFWGTLHVPPAMDPGAYELDAEPHQVRLQAQMSLPAYNLATGTQQVQVQRQILPVRDPLANQLPDGVTFCGYQHRISLRVSDPSIVTEAWTLVQVPAGGTLVIPCLPQVMCSTYFGDVPQETHLVQTGDVPHLRLHLDGKRQYKVGYQSVSVNARMGYVRSSANGQASLLVRSFYNDPSNPYAEEPPDQIGRGGHSIHVYNDGGEFGGDQSFGEMETSGRTIHPGAVDTHAHDHFSLWAYSGSQAAIQDIIYLLFGVRL